MLNETQKLFDYVTQGLKIKQTEEASAKCLLKLCSNTRNFMYPFTESIIVNVMPEDIDDWKANECHNSIIGSLGILICSVADEDQQKSSQNLKVVLNKITQPLLKNIEWIK